MTSNVITKYNVGEELNLIIINSSFRKCFQSCIKLDTKIISLWKMFQVSKRLSKEPVSQRTTLIQLSKRFIQGDKTQIACC